MSLQRDEVNLTLKSVVKPFISRVPITGPLLSLSRPHIERLGAFFLRPPSSVSVTPGKIQHMDVEWLTPDYLMREDKVLLYFHGGGYIACSPKTHRNITGRIAAITQMRVVAINYRKAPEHPFPTPIEDALIAYEFLLENGYRSENIMFAGDSAGGNLTLASMLALKERGYPMPRAGICLSPWTDLTLSGDSMEYNQDKDPMIPAHQVAYAAQAYCGQADPSDPMISPIFADLRGLPKLLIHVGDTEVLRDDSHRLVSRARSHGVDVHYKQWSKMPHVFHLFAGIVPQSSKALLDIGRFIVQTYQEAPYTNNVISLADIRGNKPH